jgi:tRNA threonylcarbamoyladenosine biosynthesis protein TsaB
MRILALDTALGACSVALLEDGVLRARRFEERTRGHAEALMDHVADVTREAGISVLSCDRFAVTIGPGTFTGLRVGLSAARGFALATKKPLVGISTLQAIAANIKTVEGGEQTQEQPGTGETAVILDAKRGEVYWAVYAASPSLRAISPPAVLSHDEALAALKAARARSDRVHLVGSGVPFVEPNPDMPWITRGTGVQPDAENIARLAAVIENPATSPPEPLYLRGPDAKPPSRNPLT